MTTEAPTGTRIHLFVDVENVFYHLTHASRAVDGSILHQRPGASARQRACSKALRNMRSWANAHVGPEPTPVVTHLYGKRHDPSMKALAYARINRLERHEAEGHANAADAMLIRDLFALIAQTLDEPVVVGTHDVAIARALAVAASFRAGVTRPSAVAKAAKEPDGSVPPTAYLITPPGAAVRTFDQRHFALSISPFVRRVALEDCGAIAADQDDRR